MFDRAPVVVFPSVAYVYPALVMALLTFVVLGALAYRRFSSIRKGEYPRRYFKIMQKPPGAELPEKAEAASRNFTNLFEVPVLFYALVALLVALGTKDDITLGLLWAFVGFRCAHSLIHVTFNDVRWRFGAYLVANGVLVVAWLRFAQLVL